MTDLATKIGELGHPREGFASTNPNVRIKDHPLTFTMDTNEIPWTPLSEGTYFKLLSADPVSGRWTTLFRMEPGARFAVHKHYGLVEFFVLKGSFGYEGGVAHAWGYGIEGAPSVHEPISGDDEEMIMLAISNGPFQGYNEDGTLGEVVDVSAFVRMAQANNALQCVEKAANVHPLGWLDRSTSTDG